MRIYTSHFRPGADVVLLAEGGSLWAGLFGWLWLLLQGAWLPAALLFLIEALVGRAALAVDLPALGLGLVLLQGIFGRDLLRLDLRRRGYAAGPVVLAANPQAALARLIDQRPDLAGMAVRGLGAAA